MTERLLRAVENRYVTAIGHPTGRLLLRRDAYRFRSGRGAEMRLPSTKSRWN